MLETRAAVHRSGDRGLDVNRAQTRQQWRKHFRGEAANLAPALQPAKSPESGRAVKAGGATRNRTGGAVRLHIEELTLRGIGQMDGRKIADAFQAELRGMIAANGVPPHWHGKSTPKDADTATVRLISQTNSRWAGEQLARAIYGIRRKGNR